MKRILLSTLSSVAIFLATQSLASPIPETMQSASVHHSKGDANSSEVVIKDVEDRLAKIKDDVASLSPDQKSEFDYNLDIVAAELKALKDTNNAHHKKHAASSQRAIQTAEGIVRKHAHQVEHAKKVEEREARKKTKAEERKARAEERKAKAESRKAERAAAKAKRAADKADMKKEHALEKVHEKELVAEQSADIAKEEKTGDLDHGRSEGGSHQAPGIEAGKPINEDKK